MKYWLFIAFVAMPFGIFSAGCAGMPEQSSKIHLPTASRSIASIRAQCYKVDGGSNRMWGQPSFMCITQTKMAIGQKEEIASANLRWGTKIHNFSEISDADTVMEIHRGFCINCFSDMGYEISLDDAEAVEGSNLSAFKIKFSALKTLPGTKAGTVEFADGLKLSYTPVNETR
jgi:hypothetical protein